LRRVRPLNPEIARVIAYHSTFTTYGFWLSNDSRGSWSEFVRSFDLYLTGAATKTDETRSLARRPLDREQRDRARAALKYPLVRFDGRQIECVARGVARAVEESGYVQRGRGRSTRRKRRRFTWGSAARRFDAFDGLRSRATRVKD
jgi:hypothetical protein